jgi:hypothetical protein
MSQIFNFETFLLAEAERKETALGKKFSKIEARIKAENPEVDLTGPEGGKDWYDAMAERPGQALQRLISGAASGIASLGKGISNLFGKKLDGDLDKKSLRGKKEEVLSKWGEDVKKTGRNKEQDYEGFYKEAIVNGKKSFGKNFDIDNPKSDEEEIYVDYVKTAKRYYDI